MNGASSQPAWVDRDDIIDLRIVLHRVLHEVELDAKA